MPLQKASVGDILRCSQRDELFIKELQEQIQTLYRLVGALNYNRTRTSIPVVANIWYYLLTSLSNLQTLGEEYTGLIRLKDGQKLPEKQFQILWLALYIGGEAMFEKVLNFTRKKVYENHSITEKAKKLLLESIDFLSDEKQTLYRLHQAVFYTNGKYYNISNRTANIRYGLVRQWMQDDSFTGSFQWLGNLSIFYIIFETIQRLWSTRSSGQVTDNTLIETTSTSRDCVICGESLKSASVTPCSHIFCWTCIHECLEYQKNCPICRQEIHYSRIILLQNI